MRRGIVVRSSTTIPFGLTSPSRAEGELAGDGALQGAGLYRFNIGEFKATVISDGYGHFDFWPALATNQDEATVKAFLAQNHVSAQPQLTNNLLVVDTPTDRVLVDTGFGDSIGPQSGHFPQLVQNLSLRRDFPGQHYRGDHLPHSRRPYFRRDDEGR